MLSVLQVGYPLAEVGPDAVGGAEQVLSALDRGLVAHGHRSLVLARSGSSVAGKLYPVHVPEGPITDAVRSRVHADYQVMLRVIVREQNVDIVHYHGVDCEEYLMSEQPTVVTLHLACTDYPASLLAHAGIQFVCVSQHQANTFTPLRTRVIQNGVDLARFRPASTSGDYFARLGSGA
jgi:hypothetical protein